jgi:hypothetical protein
LRLIKKEVAVKLLGEERFSEMIRAASTDGYVTALIMPEGIKVFRKKVGCVVRYGVYGYEPFEHDVDRAMIVRGLQG